MKAIKNEIENEESLKCDNKKITSFKKINNNQIYNFGIL